MGHGKCVKHDSMQVKPQNWNLLISKSENNLNDSKNPTLTKSTDAAQCLHSIAEECSQVSTEHSNQNNVADILQKLSTNRYTPEKYLLYERCKFFSCKQFVGQSIVQFVSELVSQAKKCMLGNLLEDLVKCMIIIGVKNSKIKEKLLQDDSLSLEEAVETCLLMEKNEHCLARALYDNIPDTPDELQFRRGDKLIVLEQNTANIEGWWLCSLRGKQEAYLNKAHYLSRIGDRENAIKTLSQAFDRTVALGYKLDNVFHCIRIGLFFMDHDLIQRNLQRAETLLEQGANWHSRNCYRMLKALYSLHTREFLVAAKLLVGAVSTFVCTELISFDNFIKYTVLSGVLALSRAEVKKDLIENPDIQQALHSNDALREYLISLFNGEYKLFFQRLADCEVMMKGDMLLNPHYKYYVREMKVKAYDQLLSTYISLNISYMAEQFGVSKDFIENEVGKLIAAGRLNYRIDKVSETVVNRRKDNKNEVFKAVLKHGDLLLNRIQKLSRVINI